MYIDAHVYIIYAIYHLQKQCPRQFLRAGGQLSQNEYACLDTSMAKHMMLKTKAVANQVIPNRHMQSSTRVCNSNDTKSINILLLLLLMRIILLLIMMIVECSQEFLSILHNEAAMGALKSAAAFVRAETRLAQNTSNFINIA